MFVDLSIPQLFCETPVAIIARLGTVIGQDDSHVHNDHYSNHDANAKCVNANDNDDAIFDESFSLLPPSSPDGPALGE